MADIDGTDDRAGRSKRELDWGDFQLFLAIAETGSFSGAGRRLGLTQPTVSQRAKDMEANAGALLFVRAPTGIVLTEAGSEMYEYVRSMKRAATSIGAILAKKDRNEEGCVRVRAPDGIATFWLAPHLSELIERAPRLKVVLDAGLWPDEPLNSADIELSIQYDANDDNGNVVVPLGVSHYMAFAAQSYLDTYGTPRTLPELAQHRAIRHVGQKSRQRGTWSTEISAFATLWGDTLQSNSSATVLAAARAGAGIAVMPSSAILFAPELVPLDPAPLVSAHKFLIYAREVEQAPRARRVIEWIKDIYDPRRNPWFREDFVHPRDFPPGPTQGQRAPGGKVTPLRSRGAGI